MFNLAFYNVDVHLLIGPWIIQNWYSVGSQEIDTQKIQEALAELLPSGKWNEALQLVKHSSVVDCGHMPAKARDGLSVAALGHYGSWDVYKDSDMA